MSDIRDVTDELLADRPSIEEDLEAILEVDDGVESWTFEDIPVDSGTFGELVSSGVIESVGDEYQVADPAAVRAALENEPQPSDNEPATDGMDLSVQLPHIDPVLAGSLVGLLALVVLLRTAAFWPSVFRGSDIVLLGNDPYFYRYWLEELFRTGGSVTSPPPALQDHDIAMIAVMHGLATLLGGGREAVSLVLTWYPVVASVIVGLLVYVIAIVSFADRRVALASVAMYAVTPIVAYRSALGFGDHHAFDYLLVALAVAGLLLLVNERADWRTVTRGRLMGFSSFALAIATQVHAWRGGPLLILPVVAYVVFRVASDVRAGYSLLQANAWTLGALAVAAGLAIVPHVVFGWSGVYRAVAPALLLAGSLVVVGIGEIAARREIAASRVLGLEAVGSIVVGGIAWITIPAVRRAGEQGIAYFVRTGQTNITETRSLLSPESGVITTPIFYLGLTFFLAVAALAWASWRVKRDHHPTWLALTTYTGGFLLLALIQLRFAGQFGILAAVFAAFGFVYLVAAVDVTSYPRPFETDSEPPESPLRERISQSAALSLPDRQAASAVVVLFLLIGSLGAVQTANGSGLVVKETTYDAATAIDAHSATAERTWPENYVFSDWGRNRVYNYYTSGQSQSYQYAQQNYESFITSREPEQWYARLSAKPTGYVVVESPEDGASAPPETMQSRLWENWGSATAEVPGTSHYRVVYANEERKVYELVSGTTIVGESQPGTEVVATAEVSIDGREFTYRNRATANPYGIYSVTVPYSGTYEISQTRVRVSEQDFQTGTRQILHDREGIAHWSFDASDEVLVYDRVGGFTAELQGATRTDGVSGRALSFDGADDEATVASDSGEDVPLLEPNGSVTISFWIRGSLGSSTARYPTVLSQQSAENGTVWGLWARTGGADDFGIRINDQEGTPVRNFGVDTTNFSQWTHVVAVLDREAGELRLYRDSQLVATTDTSELGPLASEGRLVMGSRDGRSYAPVVIDEVQIFQQSMGSEGIKRLYNGSEPGDIDG